MLTMKWLNILKFLLAIFIFTTPKKQFAKIMVYFMLLLSNTSKLSFDKKDIMKSNCLKLLLLLLFLLNI